MKIVTEVYPETLEEFRRRKLQNPETRSHAPNTGSEFRLVEARDMYLSRMYFS